MNLLRKVFSTQCLHARFWMCHAWAPTASTPCTQQTFAASGSGSGAKLILCLSHSHTTEPCSVRLRPCESVAALSWGRKPQPRSTGWRQMATSPPNLFLLGCMRWLSRPAPLLHRPDPKAVNRSLPCKPPGPSPAAQAPPRDAGLRMPGLGWF